MKKDTGNLAQAKNCAYRLLSHRERSVKELEARLAKKGFKKEIIERAVNDLKTLRLLDDYKFAKALAEQSVKYKPSGVSFIRASLYAKGISGDIINSVISDIEKKYDEYETAHRIAALKIKKCGKIDRVKAKRRLYDYLMRRRFKKEIIFEILNEIFITDTE